jgi:regulator of protease activity HflC (stomatin/prohibitin superfamily)
LLFRLTELAQNFAQSQWKSTTFDAALAQAASSTLRTAIVTLRLLLLKLSMIILSRRRMLEKIKRRGTTHIHQGHGGNKLL